MTKNTLNKTVASGILTTMVGGLILFLFNFFAQTFPRTQGEVKLLHSRIDQQGKFLERIDGKTDRILDYLMTKKKQ